MSTEYLGALAEPVMRLSEQLGVMQRAIAAAGRVFGLLDLETTVKDPPLPVPWPGLVREIGYRSVSFSYFDNGEYALRDVSFRIPRGEKWAIVGATGGGKSSILNLLLGFYDPQAGGGLPGGID